MPNVDVLRRGLSIVSRCKEETGDIWHAHYGVAAIASYYFAQENELSTETTAMINSQAEAMLNKYEFSRKMDKSHPVDSTTAERLILDALETTMDQLHWVGHNVIYSALCMLAIRDLRGWGTVGEIHHIGELIRSFERTIPGRSWLGYSASEVKRMELNIDDRFPVCNNAIELSEFILIELSQFKTIYRAEAHHDLIGHLLTFSHSLNVLYDLGHHSLFHKGISHLLKMVKVLRVSRDVKPTDSIKLNSPVDRLPLEVSQRSAYLPIEQAFWAKDFIDIDWDYGHQFKFSYSYYNHISRAPHLADVTDENFRHIISW